jgi:alpha-D-ribose 1-methylphosphonate 5-triphosphate synthase subunit PhnG
VKLIKQRVPAEAVLRMIDARLQAVTMAYTYAKGNDRKVEAEAMAETKWQLAELKMQFVELLTEQLDAAVKQDA